MALLDAQPVPLRFIEEITRQGLQIVVPAVKHRVIAVGIPLMLLALLWMEQSYIDKLVVAHSAFSLAKFLFWAVAGLVLFAKWIWMMLGREIFLLQADSLEIRSQVLGFNCRRTFAAGGISNLRFRQEEGYPLPWNPAPYYPSALLFDYAGRTYEFGCGLDSTEVDRLIVLMQQHLRLLPEGELLFRSLW